MGTALCAPPLPGDAGKMAKKNQGLTLVLTCSFNILFSFQAAIA